jgi:hypothetical protein
MQNPHRQDRRVGTRRGLVSVFPIRGGVEEAEENPGVGDAFCGEAFGVFLSYAPDVEGSGVELVGEKQVPHTARKRREQVRDDSGGVGAAFHGGALRSAG